MENGKPKFNTFTDLIVWQKAVELFEMATEDVERFPDGRTPNLVANQLVRTAGAISATIAEGHGTSRFSYRLTAAKGHANAAQDWYHKMGRLGYLPADLVQKRLDLLGEVVRMLNGLISKLIQNSIKKDAEPKAPDQK